MGARAETSMASRVFPRLLEESECCVPECWLLQRAARVGKGGWKVKRSAKVMCCDGNYAEEKEPQVV